MMVLAFCPRGLEPKVVCWLLGSKGLTKAPPAGESPQAAQAPEMHLGVWQGGDPQLRAPARTSPQAPCSSPWPKDAPAQELIQAETSPCSAELEAGQESLKHARKGLCSRNLSVPRRGLCRAPSPAPLGGSPCPALSCRGSSAVPTPAKPAAPPRRARGGGTSSGYNDCLFC